ncbi:PspA/IM30 family protein [Halothece sp. PCC 7418]|uniref:lecithin retinol acyltransferase family protein n=1 Tax=Halothece sp. (strain PCC 7418) TaxID=65093 RepID=UPI0002A070F1|nr:lecithin retinol acyltransferase family protein [Halothece sp. PCC 7418]AFZ42646.1 PspA/IM30 family protein [Halothece sp. PCC 7418]
MARGDQIYILEPFVNFQGMYEHHGIDCGDGSVIHLRKYNETITRTSFGEFTKSQKVYVKHYPLAFVPDAVVHRAESRLGEKARYNLLFNNCEHFATWCKLGHSHSQQVKDFIPILSRLKVESLSQPLEKALADQGYQNQKQLVDEALVDIKKVWEKTQPRYNQTLEEIKVWQTVAWKALQEGKEDVAKAAIQRKLRYQKQAEKDQKQLDQLAKMTETLLQSRFAQR